MVMILQVAAAAMMVFGIFFVLGLTPQQITQDMMNILRPTNRIRTMASDVQAKRQRGGVYGMLQRIRNTMEATDRGKLFPLAITGIFLLGGVGFLVGLLLNNIWLIPPFVVAFGSIPILYMSSAVDFYEKSVRNELETALSIITNAYIRTEDIVVAVKENINIIKPPLRKIFDRFIQDCAVMPSRKETILRLRERLDDAVFYEWCTTLLQCQDDRTLKVNLNPVVTKLTDIRLVNAQNEAIVASAKMQYYTMAGFVLASVPLLEVLSPGSLEIMVGNEFGKFLLGIVADLFLFTFFRMRVVARKVDFDTK